MTISEAVRAAFKTVDNPDAVDRSRVLVIARVKLAQSGNTTDEVKVHNVTQVRSQMRSRVGALTKNKIEQYERLLAQKNGRTETPVRSAAMVTTPTKPQPEAITVEHLRRAAAFIASVGGLERAAEVLQVLKEIRS
jgi:hypothetical protein